MTLRLQAIHRTTSSHDYTYRARALPYEAFLRDVLQDRDLAAAYVPLALTEGTREEALLALESVTDALRAAGPDAPAPPHPE